jgi:HAD superfamily hydrolase (TIGR01509 family)
VTAASDIFTLKHDVHEIVTKLHAANYKLQLLSNTSAAHWQYLQTIVPILGLFPKQTLSFQVHALKPETAIFEHALTLAGVSAERCFYIDDIPEYTKAAQKLGIPSHTFVGAQALQHALNTHGVAY